MSSSEGSSRDPSTAPRADASGVRQYVEGDVTVRIRGLDVAGAVRIHIEHKSGAALIVPFCERERGPAGARLATTGFDGTHYVLDLDDQAARCKVTASAETPILGGTKVLVLPRTADPVTKAPPTTLRVTGDENTMPIALKKTE